MSIAYRTQVVQTMSMLSDTILLASLPPHFEKTSEESISFVRVSVYLSACPLVILS